MSVIWRKFANGVYFNKKKLPLNVNKLGKFRFSTFLAFTNSPTNFLLYYFQVYHILVKKINKYWSTALHTWYQLLGQWNPLISLVRTTQDKIRYKFYDENPWQGEKTTGHQALFSFTINEMHVVTTCKLRLRVASWLQDMSCYY